MEEKEVVDKREANIRRAFIIYSNYNTKMIIEETLNNVYEITIGESSIILTREAMEDLFEIRYKLLYET